MKKMSLAAFAVVLAAFPVKAAELTVATAGDQVKPKLDDATWNKLFVDITPEDLATKGKPFPLAKYNTAILEAYEQSVK